MASGGDRAVEGRGIRKRREALGLTQAQLSTFAKVGLRTLEQIEAGEGGGTRIDRVLATLRRIEAGEDAASEVMRVQVRPGVYVVMEVEDTATVGDQRAAEDLLRALAADPRRK